MKGITIDARWIKEVREGRCIPWGYDYKEYVFNEYYPQAYSLRIPQNTHGIRAIELSNGSGIKDEYSLVYLENEGKLTEIFNLNPDPKDVRIEMLLLEISALKAEKNELQGRLNAVRRAMEAA